MENSQPCLASATGRPSHGSDEIRHSVALAPLCDATTTDSDRKAPTTVAQRLAATLTHELSQPLTAIGNYAGGAIRMLQAGASTQDMITTLTRIAAQAQRASDILRAERELFQRQRGAASRVDINALLRRAAALAEPRARRNQVTVRLRTTAEVPAVPADAVRLEQVLVNLISNALEAMERTPADRRELVLSSAAPTADQIEIAVHDTGEGLPADGLAQIFKPRYSTKPEGMGMGLAISRTIVEDHGGDLWAEPTPCGTRFCIRLPVPCHPDSRPGTGNS